MSEGLLHIDFVISFSANNRYLANCFQHQRNTVTGTSSMTEGLNWIWLYLFLHFLHFQL